MNTGKTANGENLDGENPLGLGVEQVSKPEFDMGISHAVAGAAGRVLQSDEMKPDAVKWIEFKKISSEFNDFVGIIEKFKSNKYSEIESDIANYHHFSEARTRLTDMFWQFDNIFQNTLDDMSIFGETVGPYVMAPIYFVIDELKKKVEKMNVLFIKGEMNDEDIEEFKSIYAEYNKFCTNYITEFNHVLSLVCDPFSIQADADKNFNDVVTEALFDALKIPAVPSGVLSQYLSQDLENVDIDEFEKSYDEFFKAAFERDEDALQLKIEKKRKILQMEFDKGISDNRGDEYFHALTKKTIKTTPEKELKTAFRWRNFELLTDSEVPVSLEFFHKIWNKLKKIKNKLT
jgi:hypothetical protein